MKIRNFIKKYGDQWSFNVQFLNNVTVNAMELGVKHDYDDENFVITKSLNQIKHKVIFVGDSYLQGFLPTGQIKNWGQIAADKEQLDTYIIKSYQGAGFSEETSFVNKRFAQLLDAVPADDTITDIVVCGGYNDRNATKSKVYAGFNEFCEIARRKFKNATIKCSMIGWSDDSSRYPSLRTCESWYKECCSINNCVYMESVQNAARNPEFYVVDHVHPNLNGQTAIGNAIAEFIKTINAGGIIKISETEYQIYVSSAEMELLDLGNYVYDLRTITGGNFDTIVSGRLIIWDSVYHG